MLKRDQKQLVCKFFDGTLNTISPTKSVYCLLSKIVGTNPGKKELIIICNYLFNITAPEVVLTRNEKRAKRLLILKLESFKNYLIPVLLDKQRQIEIFRLFVTCLTSRKIENQKKKNFNAFSNISTKIGIARAEDISAEQVQSLSYLVNAK